MNRKLGLFLVFGFFAIQLLSTLHMAEFGFKKHEHNGHVCDIYLHCEHAKYSTPSQEIVVKLPEYFSFATKLPELTFISEASYRNSPPRAPPFLS